MKIGAEAARLAAALLICAWLPVSAEQEPREVSAEKIIAATAVDRLILANARAKIASDPKAEQALDGLLYRFRPPSLWNAKHPAWAPARAALKELVGRESDRWVAEYWRESALKVHVRELAYSYRLQDIEVVREFVESPGGQAWFARRLAEARAKSGEAMFSLDPASPAALDKLARESVRKFDALPAAEKQRIASFRDAACDACGNSISKILESFIAGQSTWIADVLVSHLGSIPYSVSDPWKAELDTRLAAQLPVDSKKQLLGTLEMRGDAALVFRFTFYWNNAADGGRIALEIPKTHLGYAETLALAPGLAAGQSRVLYRGKDGVIDDKP